MSLKSQYRVRTLKQRTLSCMCLHHLGSSVSSRTPIPNTRWTYLFWKEQRISDVIPSASRVAVKYYSQRFSKLSSPLISNTFFLSLLHHYLIIKSTSLGPKLFIPFSIISILYFSYLKYHLAPVFPLETAESALSNHEGLIGSTSKRQAASDRAAYRNSKREACQHAHQDSRRGCHRIQKKK